MASNCICVCSDFAVEGLFSLLGEQLKEEEERGWN